MGNTGNSGNTGNPPKGVASKMGDYVEGKMKSMGEGTKELESVAKKSIGKRFGGDKVECNMAIQIGKQTPGDETEGFKQLLKDTSSKNLLKQLKLSNLVDEKYEVYIKDYLLVAFENFCIKIAEKKFIHYCYNILGCLKEVDHINELFIKLYELTPDEEDTEKKQFGKIDPIIEKTVQEAKNAKYAKNVENTNNAKNGGGDINELKSKEKIKKKIIDRKIKNFSMFVAIVLVNSITKFEKDVPAKKNKLSIKVKLEKIFNDIGLLEFEKVTAQSLSKKLSEDSTKKYFHKLKTKNKDKGSNSNKNNKASNDVNLDLQDDENRSNSFLYFMGGMTLLGFLLNLDLLSEPPNVQVQGGFF